MTSFLETLKLVFVRIERRTPGGIVLRQYLCCCCNKFIVVPIVCVFVLGSYDVVA